MQIHWFNPENDLALATGAPHYTPKKLAQRMHDAGSLLPIWYGDPGDQALCYGVNSRWWDTMTDTFDIKVGLFDHRPTEASCPMPWGWSAYAKRYFLDQGFSSDSLPTDSQIEKMRQLSHRRTAIEVVRRLREALPHIKIGVPAYEATTLDQAKRWISEHEGYFVKHPWSSSGRGVVDSRITTTEAMVRFATDGIGRQGSVMLEPAYVRQIDFAKLYRCEGGICTEVGTSVFDTDPKNAYAGNLVASEAQCVAAVTRYVEPQTLIEVTDTLRDIISDIIAPHYEGIVGVDMLVDTQGTIAVAEVNLRATMGYVARRFADLYLAEGAIGRFMIVPSKMTKADLTTAVVEDRHLVRGSLSLTPPDPYFAFLVEITC